MKHRLFWDGAETAWIARIGVTLGAMLGLATASCHGTGNGSQAGGGAGGTTESTGGATATIAHVCEDPVTLLQTNGSDSGFVQCADGSTDHVKSVTCVLANLPGTCDPNSTYGGDCKTAADCSAHPHGACNVHSNGYAPAIWCQCDYQCETDADCAAGEICACARPNDSFPKCMKALGCKQNTDCASGECGRSFYTNGCDRKWNLGCRGDEDACRVDGDCGGNGNCGKTDATGTWKCTDVTCTL